MAVGKILIATEEILKKANVLTELGGLAERLGCRISMNSAYNKRRFK